MKYEKNHYFYPYYYVTLINYIFKITFLLPYKMQNSTVYLVISKLAASPSRCYIWKTTCCKQLENCM